MYRPPHVICILSKNRYLTFLYRFFRMENYRNSKYWNTPFLYRSTHNSTVVFMVNDCREGLREHKSGKKYLHRHNGINVVSRHTLSAFVNVSLNSPSVCRLSDASTFSTHVVIEQEHHRARCYLSVNFLQKSRRFEGRCLPAKDCRRRTQSGILRSTRYSKNSCLKDSCLPSAPLPPQGHHRP